MHLIGIDCQVPSNKISNEDIIELVKYYSKNHFPKGISNLEILIRRFLKLTGSNTRFWRKENEKPIDIIISCVERALLKGGISKNDIDLVIYSGIDRGFFEPSNASIFCKALGMNNVRCFDIVDACMGWSTSVQTAYAYFKSDESFQNILIINAEFPMDLKGTILPENFTIREAKELDWKSPSFTLGEAVSATIYQRDDSISTQFSFIEKNEFASLCSIPLMNFEKYLLDQNEIIQSEMQFYADGAALFDNGIYPACDVLKKILTKINYTPKMVFPHSVSEKVIKSAFKNLNIELEYYSTFSELGNIATVSIPSGITKALVNGQISKGDKCIAWVASAGMKFSAHDISL